MRPFLNTFKLMAAVAGVLTCTSFPLQARAQNVAKDKPATMTSEYVDGTGCCDNRAF